MLLLISLPFKVDVPSTPFTSVVIVFVLGDPVTVGAAAATAAAVAASVAADNISFLAHPAPTPDGAFAADVSESRR